MVIIHNSLECNDKGIIKSDGFSAEDCSRIVNMFSLCFKTDLNDTRTFTDAQNRYAYKYIIRCDGYGCLNIYGLQGMTEEDMSATLDSIVCGVLYEVQERLRELPALRFRGVLHTDDYGRRKYVITELHGVGDELCRTMLANIACVTKERNFTKFKNTMSFEDGKIVAVIECGDCAEYVDFTIYDKTIKTSSGYVETLYKYKYFGYIVYELQRVGLI